MSEVTTVAPQIRGLTYPLAISNGNLSTSVDYQLINQQIRSVIETRYYERVMRADYGIGNYVLELLDPAQVNSALQYSILANVKGLTDLSVVGNWKSEGEDGVYKVYIQYSVNGVPQAPLSFTLAN